MVLPGSRPDLWQREDAGKAAADLAALAEEASADFCGGGGGDGRPRKPGGGPGTSATRTRL